MPARPLAAATRLLRSCAGAIVLVHVAAPCARAQEQYATRAAVIAAELRRAPTARDLAVIRSAARSGDPETARFGVRALGRLERPALVADLLPALRYSDAEVRAEAANALGQAVQQAKAADAERVEAALAARLDAEDDPDVRAAIEETIGRLPHATLDASLRAQRRLVAVLDKDDAVGDRLGVAKGLEALARQDRALGPLDEPTLVRLRQLAAPPPARRPDVQTASRAAAPMIERAEPLRDARVRRLALEALVSAGAADAATLARTATDPDPQVRAIAMRGAGRAAASAESSALLARGIQDDAPLVRLMALRALAARDPFAACPASLRVSSDPDPHVRLTAIDQLAACGVLPAAVDRLTRAIDDPKATSDPRGWHAAAHAIVALAHGAPVVASAALERFTTSSNAHLREYGARAAAALHDRATLERLAADANDNVSEAAIGGLSAVAGHEADAVYIAALSRSGYQVVRAAAKAIEGTPAGDAAAAPLRAAYDRLTAEARDNSRDERAAIASALKAIGVIVAAPKAPAPPGADALPDAADLRRLAAARARIAVRGAGSFDVALFASEAPAAVFRFVTLAQSGYYNGLTIHRVVPGFVVQGGSPGANEYVGDASYMRDEVGRWPHVRGALGISTRGHDTGDAQFFVDLDDNPRLDHTYTVFAQVLNGIDVVDAILEGDVIEKIDVVLGP